MYVRTQRCLLGPRRVGWCGLMVTVWTLEVDRPACYLLILFVLFVCEIRVHVTV